MKPRKAPEERSVSHSISCTPLQWARMRELAKGAAMRTSPWIVGRVLKREGFGAAGHALELDGAQQRAMRDAAAGAEEALSRLSANSDETSAGLRETVALLFEARLAEMGREGRQEVMETLLAAIVGPERAAAIAHRVRARQYG